MPGFSFCHNISNKIDNCSFNFKGFPYFYSDAFKVVCCKFVVCGNWSSGHHLKLYRLCDVVARVSATEVGDQGSMPGEAIGGQHGLPPWPLGLP